MKNQNPDGLKMETAYSALLGKILAEARKAQNIKQKDLAAAVGVGVPTWSRIENGESTLSVEQLSAACLALDTLPSKVLEVVERAMKILPEQGITVSAPRQQALSGITGTAKIALAGVAAGAVMGTSVAPIAITGAVLGRVIASAVGVTTLWGAKRKP